MCHCARIFLPHQHNFFQPKYQIWLPMTPFSSPKSDIWGDPVRVTDTQGKCSDGLQGLITAEQLHWTRCSPAKETIKIKAGAGAQRQLYLWGACNQTGMRLKVLIATLRLAPKQSSGSPPHNKGFPKRQPNGTLKWLPATANYNQWKWKAHASKEWATQLKSLVTVHNWLCNRCWTSLIKFKIKSTLK